ncbi:hypothetical protein I79_014473 [Cricetulus griseus]|uniref:Uncharacterized protein n=1 Tax=Cricetulus griseus TaxID=10029 RepID=G3HU67_CRIGR|nr:hypothetical protein I79_014473 [Cricetulus griseus]ERE84635.1 hypothetical protein H671_2g5815 [Cricetulus griseus]
MDSHVSLEMLFFYGQVVNHAWEAGVSYRVTFLTYLLKIIHHPVLAANHLTLTQLDLPPQVPQRGLASIC